jgi:hypothetical protein
MFRTLLLTIGLAASAGAQDWGPVAFLIGHWKGDGGGDPGLGRGAFSFVSDLQGKVLVRRNFAEYPAANGKPAFRHDDLMIVYRDGKQLKADYYDNEEHVIHYTVRASPAGGAVFESDAAQPGPRFRMTYIPNGAVAITIKFEIAPPGKDFATYIEARARRD